MIKFELWDDTGKTGTINVPIPSRWYLRWALKIAAWIWAKVYEAQNG